MPKRLSDFTRMSEADCVMRARLKMRDFWRERAHESQDPENKKTFNEVADGCEKRAKEVKP